MKNEGVSPFLVADNKDDWVCPPCTKPNLRASENGSHRCLPEYIIRLRHWGILTPCEYFKLIVHTELLMLIADGEEDQLHAGQEMEKTAAGEL